MNERRLFSRLAVTLSGHILYEGSEVPVVINNFDVPIEISDISEIGIGFQFKTTDLPEGVSFHVGTVLSIEFVDDEYDGEDKLQKCTFEIVQLRERLHHTFIGGRLKSNDTLYPKYVQEKKKKRLEVDAANLDAFLNDLIDV